MSSTAFLIIIFGIWLVFNADKLAWVMSGKLALKQPIIWDTDYIPRV